MNYKKFDNRKFTDISDLTDEIIKNYKLIEGNKGDILRIFTESGLIFNLDGVGNIGSANAYLENEKYEDVVIIQSMLTGEKYVMCEIVKLKDYLDVGED